jgi:hypothetical protein
MSQDSGKLVVTLTLFREEDPALFDHIARFRKGRARAARLKTLVGKGLIQEQLHGGHAGGSGSATSRKETNADGVLDEIFATPKR